MTYFFETYGCEMNIAESASVEQILISRGWKKAENAQLANLGHTCKETETYLAVFGFQYAVESLKSFFEVIRNFRIPKIVNNGFIIFIYEDDNLSASLLIGRINDSLKSD